jgi:protocatechuate 3,4-dioxygenase beta subunit
MKPGRRENARQLQFEPIPGDGAYLRLTPEEDNVRDDDQPIGHLFSRRQALALLASTGAAAFLGCRSRNGEAAASTTASNAQLQPGCVARPRQTEGPYFVDVQLNRSDIRTDPARGNAVSEGTPLELSFRVSSLAAGACTPLAGAIVDVWQCDAAGVYSGVSDPSFDTSGQQFLRGHQITDAAGTAAFTTIYPGWYPGRTVHIHFKVRSSPAADRGHEFVSQLYFPEGVTDEVHSHPPYAAKGRRDRVNAQDGIYGRNGGSQLMLAPVRTAGGYRASFDIALAMD